jgi:glycyl-tRNA synthetase
MSENSTEKKDIIPYLKHYGFLLPNAEIYGGLAKFWDLGPYGAELKKNLKSLWWKYFITSSPYNVGCDSQIITHPQVLEASGHRKNFYDWLVECHQCRKRHRLDNLINAEEFSDFLKRDDKSNYSVKGNCPNCGKSDFHPPRQFNLLLTTNLEITDEKENTVYLRPETCQGIFVNFPAIQRSTRRQLPFGIGQIGKSFRNEITLHHGIFRMREFEQMELEFFCAPDENESEKWWNYWTEKAWRFLDKVIVNNKEKIKKMDLKKEDLPHYAKKTRDFFFHYHFGWGELCSNSHRGNYDLSQHGQHSKKDLSINGTIPEVIEVSFGVERLMLAILEDSYQEEIMKDTRGEISERKVLRLPSLLAPYFVAVIPLPVGKKKGQEEIQIKAYQVYCELLKNNNFPVAYEETDNIGKSYRRQDAIGTYYCLTVDKLTISERLQDDTLNPDYGTVTLRHRDTMKQKRITVDSLKNYLIELYEKQF